MKKQFFIWIVWILGAACPSAWAGLSPMCDTLVLANGHQIIATILTETQNDFTLEYCNAERTVILPKSQVNQVRRFVKPLIEKKTKPPKIRKRKDRKLERDLWEISTNPLFILYQIIPLSIQKPLNKNFEVGIDLWRNLSNESKNTMFAYGKINYFIVPTKGANGLYIGAFGGIYQFDHSTKNFLFPRHNYKVHRLKYAGYGFSIGYKILFKNDIFLNIGVGGGTGFHINNPEAYQEKEGIANYQFHLGYRFGKARK